MCDALNKYLMETWQRDKVMQVAQFLPLALYGPAASAGCPALSKSLQSLSGMADAYRAITRLSLILNALSKPTLESLRKSQGDAVLDRVDQLNHFFHIGHRVFEDTAVLSSHGVYPSSLSRVGACGVVCWFYTLVLGIFRQAYVLGKSNPSEEDKKRGQVNLLKLCCFFVFALTCMPKDGPQLLTDVSGPLVPLHKALRLIAPKQLPLSDTARGALGTVAALCEFY